MNKLKAAYFKYFLMICMVFTLFLLFSNCTQNSKIQSKDTNKEHDVNAISEREEAIYDIINTTLKQLIPEHSKSENTLVVHERFLVADKSLIDEFIAQGGNKLLLALDRNRNSSIYLNIHRIQNFKKTVILNSYPLTTDEFNRNIGGVIYSRIIFNQDNSKASFIFNFERMHNKSTTKLLAIVVERIKGRWKITSKISSKNPHGTLYA